MDDISLEMGFANSRASWPPPKLPAALRVMNDQVMASTSPRPASTRRARRTRRWISVRTGRATPVKRGMGADGTLSSPAMRTTSSTRSAAPWMSGRQARRRHLRGRAGAFDRKAQRFERCANLLLGQRDAGELLDHAEREADDLLRLWRRTGNPRLRRLAAGHFQHHGGGEIETGLDEGRIDAALEAIARIALHAGLAAGRCRTQADRSRRTRSGCSWSRW